MSSFNLKPRANPDAAYSDSFAGSDEVLAVFSGDDTDLRFLDLKGCIVALYAKGNAKKDTSGFVRD